MSEHPFTAALHADGPLAELPDVAPPLRPSTTFDRVGGDVYRRDGHETVRRLEAVLGALEGGHAVVYPSGMAAVDALLRHLQPRRVSLPDERYHGVHDLVHRQAERGRWALAATDSLRQGDVCWLETPSNPTCRITDIAAVAAEAGERGVIVVVDATFATPVLQSTLSLGADYAMHSTTKFIGGHSDAMGGVIVTADEGDATALRQARARHGVVPGAMETWLTLRGVRTLPLRVARQSATALAVAEHLVGRVAAVHYPGLPTDPGYEVASRQMRAYGGVLAFDTGSEAAARVVVRSFAVFRRATSLGGVESLAEHRLDSDPYAGPGVIRLSIGLEEPEVLTADLDRALSALG